MAIFILDIHDDYIEIKLVGERFASQIELDVFEDLDPVGVLRRYSLHRKLE